MQPSKTEFRKILERRVDELPIAFRAVFVLREVERLSSSETAECLQIPEGTVRSRLFKARALLRSGLSTDLHGVPMEVFRFASERSDRIVAKVLTTLPCACSHGRGQP